MRPSDRIIGSIALAVLAGGLIAGCQGSNVPMPANGPQNQFFSTNNAQIRFVDGAPNAGPPTASGSPCPSNNSCAVDVVIDGAPISTVVGSFNPYDNPIGGTIGPYYSFPSGQALIQVFEHGTTTLVFEGAVSVSAGKKYSFVLAGQAPASPPPAPPFYAAFLFTDTAYQSTTGSTQGNFHNASINAPSVTFIADCSACPPPPAGQPIGSGAFASGKASGLVQLTPSGEYLFTGSNSGGNAGASSSIIEVKSIDGHDAGSTLPDPFAPSQPNVSVYAVDTLGTGFELIGTLDSNG